MEYLIRKGTPADRNELQDIIDESVRGLSRDDYTPREIELSIGTVFGVDDELIADGTYFVAESEGKIIACGGWSKRRTLYGSSNFQHSREGGLLDPATDAAKIRAFFVHPAFARMGIGSAILVACEDEAAAAGFRSAEMMATLPGIKFYTARGYTSGEKVEVPLGPGESITCVRMRKTL